jgi:serine/threonine-protein kinase HipA
MEVAIYAWAPIGGKYHLAARLLWDATSEIGRFRYAPEWMVRPGSYPLDPINFPFSNAEKVVDENHGIPGVIADAGPDSWGRSVIVEIGADVPRNEAEWVLHPRAVGTGALRFSGSADVPPDTHDAYPACTLEQLFEVAMVLATGGTIDPPMRQIMGAMSSPGGARPKALVLRDGKQHIAKFEKPNDPFNIPRVEAACLKAAARCGIGTALARVVDIRPDHAALLVERFDRSAEGAPIHYLSARSLSNIGRVRAGRDDVPPRGTATYQALAAYARQLGIPDAGREVLRRMVFNYLIGNTDDHLQNIGFLFEAGRWKFAPAFDLLPHPGDIHAIGIGPKGRLRSLANLREGAAMFGLPESEVQEIVGSVVEGLSCLDELMVAEGVIERHRAVVRSRLSSLLTSDRELDLDRP